MFPAWHKAIDKRLDANGGKYIVGDKITIADFALAYVGFGLLLNEANPHYAETWELIKDNETMKKYAASLKEELGAHLSTRPSPRPFWGLRSSLTKTKSS